MKQRWKRVMVPSARRQIHKLWRWAMRSRHVLVGCLTLALLSIVVASCKEEYLREGCRFAGRCPDVREICRNEVPEDITVDDMFVKCHKFTDRYPKTEEMALPG